MLPAASATDFHAGGHVQPFDLLEGIRVRGQPYALAHHAVQVDEHLVAQEPIHLLLSSAVVAHQPAQRSLLVRGVMVDVHFRISLELRDRVVDESFKGTSLFGIIVTPPGSILTVHIDGAEEILEGHVTRQAIALHVEEDVTR